jgi:hypothetical protein
VTYPVQKQRELIDQAFDQLADSTVPLSAALDTATRLAQLRRDYANLWWLRFEGVGMERRADFQMVDAEMRGYFVGAEYDQHRDQVIREAMVRRAYQEDGKDLVMGPGIRELERQLTLVHETVKASEPPQGLHQLDLYFANERHQKTLLGLLPRRQQIEEVLNRVRARLQGYLLATEAAIEVTQIAGGAFDRVRAAVDGRLSEVAPEALVQFRAAYERVAAGDDEARSHALTSCRRVLASVADALYPPSDMPLVDAAGKHHALTAEKWKNRLCAYAAERIPGDASRSLTLANLDELDRRLTALNNLTSKGIHGSVSADEVDQAIVQTYLLIGDLIRLPEPAPAAHSSPAADIAGETGERTTE